MEEKENGDERRGCWRERERGRGRRMKRRRGVRKERGRVKGDEGIWERRKDGCWKVWVNR